MRRTSRSLFLIIILAIPLLVLGNAYEYKTKANREEQAKDGPKSITQSIGVNQTKTIIIDKKNSYCEYNLELPELGIYNLSLQAKSTKNETSSIKVMLISHKPSTIRGVEGKSTVWSLNFWQKTITTTYDTIENVSKEVEHIYPENITIMIKYESGSVTLNISWYYEPIEILENATLNITTEEDDFKKLYKVQLEYGVYRVQVEANDSVDIAMFSPSEPKEKTISVENETKAFIWLSLAGPQYMKLEAPNSNTSINISIVLLDYQNCSIPYDGMLKIESGKHRYLVFKVTEVELLNLSMAVKNDGWEAGCRAYIQDRSTDIWINDSLVSGERESYYISELYLTISREDAQYVLGETMDSVYGLALYGHQKGNDSRLMWYDVVDMDILSTNSEMYLILDVYAENITDVPENNVNISLKIGRLSPRVLREGIHMLEIREEVSAIDIYVARVEGGIGDIIKIDILSGGYYGIGFISGKQYILKNFDNPSDEYTFFPIITDETYVLFVYDSDLYVNITYIRPQPTTSTVVLGEDMASLYIEDTPPRFTISTTSSFSRPKLGIFIISDEGKPQTIIFEGDILPGYIELRSHQAMEIEYEVNPLYVGSGTYIIVTNYGDSSVDITVKTPKPVEEMLHAESIKSMAIGLGIGVAIGFAVPIILMRIGKRRGR